MHGGLESAPDSGPSPPDGLNEGGACERDTDTGIRLVVASDTRLLRESIADTVGRRDGVCVIATCADSGHVLAVALELRPDVVLLDMAMPASLEVVREIAAATQDVKVVAFAVADADSAVMACIEAGAVGYVPRHASGADLIAAVVSVRRGETLCSPRLAASLFRRLAALSRDAPPDTGQAALTHREREITALLGQGLSNKEIAHRLCIELATVKNHVHHILEKLKVQRRWQAAACIRGTRAAYQQLPDRT
jgi:two-component system nitrate/nitrite response regulator NarL